jgi:DNA-binding NarL/FixJ family response regulator
MTHFTLDWTANSSKTSALLAYFWAEGCAQKPEARPHMINILLLEDLPQIRAWLKVLVQQVFPDSQVFESARVHDALSMVEAMKFNLALIDLGLPDGSGVDVVGALRDQQPDCQSVVVTIHDDDDHLFPALQAGAFGYLLKEQARELIAEQLNRMSQGEPPLSPSIARRVLSHFSEPPTTAVERPQNVPRVALTERENDVLLRVAKGYTLPEIGLQLNLSRHTIADYVKQIYRKLNVSSRAEAALEAQRLGLFKLKR